ncbi:RAS small monomeric GTPase [Aspergillus sp. HF37]|nr:RAS small monomeric GTPase [Aspergillus sp. HF37]
MADKVSITVCGDGGCGKSSLTLRLVRSEWMHEYDPTIEDSYSVTRTIDGLPYLLSLTDTAGQEEYRGLWETANMKSDAFLLVYDITNEASLAALSFFLDLIAIEAEQREEDNDRLMKELGEEVEIEGLEVGLPPPVTIIAGNKCDLKDARVVNARDGLDTARKHGCGFMETSARDMVNVEETFALLVRRVVEARKQHYQQASPSKKAQNAATESAAAVGRTAVGAEPGPAEKKAKRIRFLGLGREDKEAKQDQDQNQDRTGKGWRCLRCW